MLGGFPLALNDALLSRAYDLLDELDTKERYPFWHAEEEALLGIIQGLREAELAMS